MTLVKVFKMLRIFGSYYQKLFFRTESVFKLSDKTFRQVEASYIEFSQHDSFWIQMTWKWKPSNKEYGMAKKCKHIMQMSILKMEIGCYMPSIYMISMLVTTLLLHMHKEINLKYFFYLLCLADIRDTVTSYWRWYTFSTVIPVDELYPRPIVYLR